MKIVLVNPPQSIEDIYGKYSDLASFQPPVGLCCLASYLMKNGYEVEIIDANILNMTVEETAKTSFKDSPRLIGIYTNTANYYVVSKVVSAIKEIDGSQKIVLGGPHATFLPQDSLMETRADYCIVGEGEETLLELARAIEDGSGEFAKIDGLAFKDEQKSVIINKPRKRIENLDSLPFPAVDLLPPLLNYKLYLLMQYNKLPYMTWVSSRGCPYRCVFCNTPFGKTVKYHSPAYVADFLDFLSKKFGVKNMFFCDDTFTSDENRVFELCGLLKKRKIDISWYASVRANIKNRDIFREMRSAGCWTCAVGVESGDPEILRLMRKNISLDDVKNTCESILKAGLILKTFFIIGSPNETVKTIDRTIRFANSLKAHYPVFSLMTPFPGTELWASAEKYGTFDRSNYNKLLLAGSDPVFIPYGLTKKLLIKKQNEAFRKTYCNAGMVARQLSTIRTPGDVVKLFKASLAFIKTQLR